MKIKINNRFGVIPNALLSNPNITFKAKGLYGYIQSKPDDWDFSAARIAYETKDGRDGISSGLQELEQFGYLKRYKYKNEKGQWQIDYELMESPTITENPTWECAETTTENPATENPATENPATYKTRNTKKEILKNNDNTCDLFLFENFWIIYKRKIDKGRAEKTFNRLTTEEKLLAASGAKKWAEFWEADKTDLQYIPHPTTWLNNRRWEITPPKTTKKAPANAYQDQPDSFLDGFTK